MFVFKDDFMGSMATYSLSIVTLNFFIIRLAYFPEFNAITMVQKY